MDKKPTRRRNGRTRLFRGLGWLAVAGMLGLALVGPGVGTAAAASVGGLLLVLLGGWMIVGRRRQPR